MRRAWRCWLAGALLAGCGPLEGFGGPTPPLVSFDVVVKGDAPQALRVALVWGSQWQTEPFCILPPESPEAAAVIAAGCRDPFGFVPLRVAADAPVAADGSATLSLFGLPAADVLVGGVTARVAYASVVAYDDRDGDGTLQLSRPHRTRTRGDEGDQEEPADAVDVVQGASFITMTAPDQRVAFREGSFVASAFYPRRGCGDPPPQFSVLAAGGFSPTDALAAAATGQLPLEDPATCAETAPADAVIQVPLQDPAQLREVACIERFDNSAIRYREPPADAPDLSGRLTACAHLPSFDAGNQSSLIQLVVSGHAGDRCEGLTHYTLRGCRENVACAAPDWDYTATPPAWWPCPN